MLAVSCVVCAKVTLAAYSPSERAQLYLERATALISDGAYSQARSYLDAIVPSPYLSPRQRARAFYSRGFSFYAQDLFVSAAQDYARALEFNPNHGGSLAALAAMYSDGEGVMRSTSTAFRFALKAARGGNSQGKLIAGVSLLHGRGVQRDLKKARFWLREAAEEDEFVPAYTHYAVTFREGFSEEPEPVQALRWYELAEAEGSEAATLAIAHMYRKGELGEDAIAQSVERFERLAGDGHGAAQAALAHIYLTDDGRYRDYAAARSWYQKAAAAGVSEAFLGLGHIYQAGTGVTVDLEQAQHWYRKGAQLNHTGCQVRLATLLYDASDEDAARDALAWFEAAAAAGHVEALNATAWIRATSRHAALRDGARAVSMARAANSQSPLPSTLDTLAAALAETGDFEEAIALQKSVLADTELTGADRVEFQSHLDAFEQGIPWRE